MVEQALAVLALEREDLTQLLLEQVGPVEAVVDLGDPGQLGRLLLGEVFGVLPQRVPGVFEVAGVPAEALLAGRVPGLAANLVQLSLIHISEPTRLGMISYAVFCLKK